MSIVKNLTTVAATAGIAMVLGSPAAQAGDESMSFFVTCVGMGNCANLGGIAGADGHCQKLAKAAGTNMKKRGKAARDRIGKGPWHNAKGVFVAGDLD